MTEYVKLNKVLPLISKAVREEDGNLSLLAYALDGYNLLDVPSQQLEEVNLFKVEDHKVQLCDKIKTINLATYMFKNPTSTECGALEGCLDIVSGESQEEFNLTESTNPCAGNYAISHKLFLATDYYNNNFEPMKYVGTSQYVCSNCANRFCHACNQTFSVDHNKVLWTSFKDGYICLWYNVVAKDEDGDFLIINDPDVLRYLAYWTELQHFRNRMYAHEEGTLSIVDRLEGKVNMWYLKAKGALNSKNLNVALISEITNNSYNAKFFNMLPYNYRSRYEVGTFGYKQRY